MNIELSQAERVALVIAVGMARTLERPLPSSLDSAVDKLVGEDSAGAASAQGGSDAEAPSPAAAKDEEAGIFYADGQRDVYETEVEFPFRVPVTVTARRPRGVDCGVVSVEIGNETLVADLQAMLGG